MRVLVVHCHPCADSFSAAAFARVLAGLAAGDHEVRARDLYGERFRPELSAWERTNQFAPPESKPDIAPHVADLRWCEALVFAYPTWYSGQPAMLKGWIDRVFVPGVAYEIPVGGDRVHPLLGNIRRLVVVTTHGSSKLINSIQGEGGKRVVNRSLRVLCNRRARSRWIALYGIDTVGEKARAAFLDRVEHELRDLN